MWCDVMWLTGPQMNLEVFNSIKWTYSRERIKKKLYVKPDHTVKVWNVCQPCTSHSIMKVWKDSRLRTSNLPFSPRRAQMSKQLILWSWEPFWYQPKKMKFDFLLFSCVRAQSYNFHAPKFLSSQVATRQRCGLCAAVLWALCKQKQTKKEKQRHSYNSVS